MLWEQDISMSQYSSLKNKLIKGDSIDELKKLKDNSVDLLCTDPPYGYGFMGKSWDKTLPPKEIFQESLRVLKPGAFAFVMSAPRSDVQYRMAQMLEDVGFEIGYTPIYWTYATGFPKASNIGKMVDKRLGKERKVIGTKIGKGGENLNKLSRENKGDDEEAKGMGAYGVGAKQVNVEIPITEPKSDEAKKLDGSYAGYQPKPAIEVVIVAMKPLSQKGYLDQSLDNQKGITWLDDCRIPFAGMNDKEQFDKDNVAGMMNFDEKYEKGEGKMYEGGWEKPMRTSTKSESSPLGRFSANLLVSDDVLNDGTITKSNSKTGVRKAGSELGQSAGWNDHKNKDTVRHGVQDEGGFSRYYSLDAWWNSRLSKLPDEVKNTFPFLVVPKASKSEKNNGVENNIHPTVKPLNLMSYLVTLGSRKDDVVLDPFMGSGTTPMACVTLGRNYIGVEREEEYFEIAEARVNKLEKPMKQWEQWL